MTQYSGENLVDEFSLADSWGDWHRRILQIFLGYKYKVRLVTHSNNIKFPFFLCWLVTYVIGGY